MSSNQRTNESSGLNMNQIVILVLLLLAIPVGFTHLLPVSAKESAPQTELSVMPVAMQATQYVVAFGDAQVQIREESDSTVAVLFENPSDRQVTIEMGWDFKPLTVSGSWQVMPPERLGVTQLVLSENERKIVCFIRRSLHPDSAGMIVECLKVP